jgi:hypothetical protein
MLRVDMRYGPVRYLEHLYYAPLHEDEEVDYFLNLRSPADIVAGHISPQLFLASVGYLS